ncbi:MAG: twin-arginine translocation signal domain-containing protein, partial [Myxococcota bacterium]|nr:twin-arginine translocation signal domain-containing protein [Myxococcota bacterium]
MDETRRSFLRKAGVGLVGAGLGISLPGVGRAIDGSFIPDFSVNPEDAHENPWSGLIDFCPGGKRILEIVLYGGLSPWETFWVGSGGGDMF